MKKALLLPFLVFSSLFVFAGGNIVLKPNIGIGITKFSEDIEGVKNEATLGTEFGVDLLIGRKVYFQTGLRYIKDSYKVSGNINSLSDFKTKVHNIGIKVPMHIGLYLVDVEATNLIKVRIFTGPSFKATTTINDEGDDFLDKDKYSDVTWGYQVGLGLDIWKVFLDAGYEIGLSEMIKDTSIKSNGAYITTGFLIRF
jgi:hypothetical protein